MAAGPAPELHAGSTPASEYENVCVVPDVVIGPTVPPTARLPLYEKYGTKPPAVSVRDGREGEDGG